MTNRIRKGATQGLIPYEGADTPVDLGSQNITTTGTITAGLFQGPGGGGGAVDSVNTQTGVVVLDTDDIDEGSMNLYFTDERAQDAVGTIFTDSSSIDFTYTDATPAITAVVKPTSVTNAMLAGSIASSKLVGTDITTVGTLGAGSLGVGFTTVVVARGGTGATSFTSSALLQGAGTGAITPLALGTANRVLGMNNAATAHEYKTITTGTSGTDVAVANSTNTITINVPNVASGVRGVIPASGSATISPTITFEAIPVLPNTNPTTANQATRKAYVDAIASSIDPSLQRLPCRVATNAAGTLATSFENGDVVDGITLATGDRILIKNQVSQAENGIYTVNASGAPTRAVDSDSAAEVAQGTSTYVINGTEKGLYIQIEVVTTLNTDPLNYALVGSPTDYNFAVGTAGTDFDIDVSGVDITFNLPTASATNRGALSSADHIIFSAKAGVSGATTATQIPVFTDTAGTIANSGVTLTTASSTQTFSTTGKLAFTSGATGTTAPSDITFTANNRSGTQTAGGSINFTAGSDAAGGASGDGGGITMTAGSADNSSNNAGSISLVGGGGGSNGTGNVTLTAGQNGKVVIKGGVGSFTNGTITIENPLSLTPGNITLFPQYSASNVAGMVKIVRGIQPFGIEYALSIDPNNLTADRTIEIPDASGTFAVSASGNIALDANGNITATGLAPTTDVQIFASSGTWTKPSGTPKMTKIIAIGGGGGGGSGRKGAAGTVRSGGAGGGAGGYATATFVTSILGATETVTVGTGGAGGTAVSASTTNGNAGSAGINTTFGDWLRAAAGRGGNGGSTTAATGGTAGSFFPPSVSGSNTVNGASSSGSGAGGGNPVTISFGPGSGGSGGGITTGNVAGSGGSGGGVGTGNTGVNSGYGTSLTGGQSGATSSAGGAGNASPTNSGVGGSGGGGGGASTTTNGGAGGAGALYGAGGGGGGAATNSVGNSGAGGAGADGWLIAITTY